MTFTAALSSSALSARPGGVVGCDLIVTNDGGAAGALRVEASGEAATWAIALPAHVDVAPGTKRRTRVTFAVPETGRLPGRSVGFTVAVWGPSDEGPVVELPGRIDVADVHQVSLLVTPMVSRSRRRTHHAVVLKNRGTVAERVALAAPEGLGRLAVTVSPAEVTLGPGDEATAELSIRARRPYFGRGAALTHRVAVVATSEGAGPRTAEAVWFQERARWRLPAVVAGAALTIAALVAWAGAKAPAATDEASGGRPTSAALASPCPVAPADGAAHIVISGFAFCPAATTVEAGTEVTWINEDAAPHTATFDGESLQPPFDSGPLAPGQAFTVRVDVPGTYVYSCRLHAGMTGTIRVTG